MPKYDFSGLSKQAFEYLLQMALLHVHQSSQSFLVFSEEPKHFSWISQSTMIPDETEDYKFTVFPIFPPLGLERSEKKQWIFDYLKQLIDLDLGDTFFLLDKKESNSLPLVFAIPLDLGLTEKENLTKLAVQLVDKLNTEKCLNFKGCIIWDSVTVKGWISDNEVFREKALPWIGTQNVLQSSIPNSLNPKELGQALIEYLSAELENDLCVNLDQAGDSSDEPIPLAKVFVDLPAYEQQKSFPPDEEEEKPYSVVQSILDASRNVFRNKKVIIPFMEERTLYEQFYKEQKTSFYESGRVVLIGGPGQGKTTISQFICQIFRTVLLKTVSGQKKKVINQVYQQIKKSNDNLGLDENLVKRFPFRIVLNEFAKYIATTKQGNGVTQYLVQQIEEVSGTKISKSDFWDWFCSYPQILVLDGLDEVPPTSNRDTLLQEIHKFLENSSHSHADILVVATSRPQGYNHDFSPKHFQHLWLSPLSADRAIDYATRLIEVRFKQNPQRGKLVLGRLETAKDYEQTRRLMHSPLQITIMAALVNRMGQPPQEKWNLFNEYYRVIYEREVERGNITSSILREYKQDIDIIHHRVGLLLQVESEQSGKTDARIDIQILEKLVESRLKEEGHKGKRLEKLKKTIIEMAMNRLVFLVGVTSNRIGFEIRSIQEFMAAQALMDGGDEVVANRLKEIAPIIHWRNVFIFAAGSCFINRQYLRDTLVEICRELDGKNSRADTTIPMPGARLALELWEDGSSSHQPKYYRLLVSIALQLLELPPDESLYRIKNQIHGNLDSLFEEEIDKQFSILPVEKNLGGWFLLFRLMEDKNPWIEKIAEKHWPSKTQDQLWIINAFFNGSSEFSHWAMKKLIEITPKISPSEFLRIDLSLVRLSYGLAGDLSSFGYPTWFVSLVTTVSQKEKISIDIPISISSNEKSQLCLSVQPIQSEHWKNLQDLPYQIDSWLSLKLVGTFIESASEKKLGEILKTLALKVDITELHKISKKLPWIMAGPILVSKDALELQSIALEIGQGKYGSYSDWIMKESEWISGGIILNDLSSSIDSIQSNIEELFQYFTLFTKLTQNKEGNQIFPDYLTIIRNLCSLFSNTTKFSIQNLLSLCILESISFLSIVSYHDMQKILDLVSYQLFQEILSLQKLSSYDMEEVIKSVPLKDFAQIECITAVNKMGEIAPISHFGVTSKELFQKLIEVYESDNSLEGVFRILLGIVIGEILNGQSVPTPSFNTNKNHFHSETQQFYQLLKYELSDEDIPVAIKLIFELAKSQNNFSIPTLALLLNPPTSTRWEFTEKLYAQLTPDQWKDAQWVTQGFHDIQLKQTSYLHDAKVWMDLKLPVGLNQLIQSNQQKKKQEIKIQSLELRNIGGFEKLTLDFDRSYTALVGLNGTGKTTILRAITLAILGYKEKRSQDKLKSFLKIKGRNKEGVNWTDEGTIQLKINIDKKECENKITFTPNSDEEKINIVGKPFEELHEQEYYKCLIIGFGQKHGLFINPNQQKLPEVNPPKVPDLLPLLHQTERNALESFASWVAGLYLDTKKGEHSKQQLLDKTFQVFSDLTDTTMTLDTVELNPFRVWIKSDAIPGGIPLDLASQGYQVLMSWIGFLLQRMYEANQDLDEFWQANAIVLVDEIDSYMHPKWQTKIIDVLKDHFPNTQFIVTTHSPLVVDGAERGQVIHLKHDGEQLKAVKNSVDIWAWNYQEIFEELFETSQEFKHYEEKLLPAIDKLLKKKERSSDEEEELKQLKISLERVLESRAEVDQIAAIRQRMEKKEKELDDILEQLK